MYVLYVDPVLLHDASLPPRITNHQLIRKSVFFSCRHVLVGQKCLHFVPFFDRLQDPEGEPLMLDRFDARWMLDLADFSKGFGSRMSTALAAEVGSLRDSCVFPGRGGRGWGGGVGGVSCRGKIARSFVLIVHAIFVISVIRVRRHTEVVFL